MGGFFLFANFEPQPLRETNWLTKKVLLNPAFITETMARDLFGNIPLDFWLFDSSSVFDMLYTGDGAFKEGEKGGQPLDFYLRARDSLLKRSIPLEIKAPKDQDRLRRRRS